MNDRQGDIPSLSASLMAAMSVNVKTRSPFAKSRWMDTRQLENWRDDHGGGAIERRDRRARDQVWCRERKISIAYKRRRRTYPTGIHTDAQFVFNPILSSECFCAQATGARIPLFGVDRGCAARLTVGGHLSPASSCAFCQRKMTSGISDVSWILRTKRQSGMSHMGVIRGNESLTQLEDETCKSEGASAVERRSPTSRSVPRSSSMDHIALALRFNASGAMMPVLRMSVQLEISGE